MKKYKCPCCGYFTVYGETGEICPVCFWEDDPFVDYDDVDTISCANGVSLKEARANFLKFGACTEFDISFVRPPRDDEK